MKELYHSCQKALLLLSSNFLTIVIKLFDKYSKVSSIDTLQLELDTFPKKRALFHITSR